MPADVVQANYDELDRVAARFGAQAENLRQQQHWLEHQVAVLEDGGWRGRGIEAFSREMRSEVFLAVERLHRALSEAQQVTLAVSAVIRAAEEDAAALFDDRTRGDISEQSSDVLPESDLLEKNDFLGIHLPENLDALQPPHSESFIDQVLSLKFPMWLDIPLSLVWVGDLIDIVREQVINRFSGEEPDTLVTTLAALGLALDFGWLDPAPVEELPNAAVAVLKAIAKRLPAGASRDALADIVKISMDNPSAMARLGETTAQLAANPKLFDTLLDNPRAMVAAFEGGTETVQLLNKYGDDAIKASQLLGEHAPAYLRYYDSLADVPGAKHLLRDLGSGDTTTFGAMGELYYFQSIKDEVAQVGLTLNGRKAADGILHDGTIVDVKNLNFDSRFYGYDSNIDNAISKLEKQVELRRSQYGDDAKIRYVFTTPRGEIPPKILQRLDEIGVDVRTIGPE